MSGIVRLMVSLVVGLALGISYNAWPIAGDVSFASGRSAVHTIDIMSYVSGMMVGIVLWQISSVPWAQLPQQVNAYLASQMHFYQFVVLGAACVAVLVYL